MIFVFDLKLSSFFLLVPQVLSLPFRTWCLPKDSRFVWKDHLSSCTITCFTCRPLGPTKDFILSKVVKALSIIFLSSNSEQFSKKLFFYLLIWTLPFGLNLKEANAFFCMSCLVFSWSWWGLPWMTPTVIIKNNNIFMILLITKILMIFILTPLFLFPN